MTTLPLTLPREFTTPLRQVVDTERCIDEAKQHQTHDGDEPALNVAIREAVHESRLRAEAFHRNVSVSGRSRLTTVGRGLAGRAYSMVGRFRPEAHSLGLRDDFVNCTLAAANYSMLHTTAIALENEAVAGFAAQGLRTYARLISDIRRAFPAAVVHDLSGIDGFFMIDINAAAIATSQQLGLWSIPCTDH
ncbi:MAG: hypothetical protein WKF81_05220 [Thermomicrobiales bacterium]